MKTITINCSYCRTPFAKFKGEYDRQIRNGNSKFFCSKECCIVHKKKVLDAYGMLLRSENEKKYYLSPKQCPQCQNIIPYDSRANTYCSQKCGALYSQKDGGHGGNLEWTKTQREEQSARLKTNPIFYKNHFHSVKIKCKCPSCKILFEKVPSSKRIYCSQKCYFQSIKNGYLKGKSGGYRERGGRGNQGWYKGYYCHSTWELAWVIYNLEHGIPFVRNTSGFEYELDGKKHKFYPDFILETGEYVEIKGWDNGTVGAKLACFPHKLTVLRVNEMVPYLQYATEKYGKELKCLYEKCI